MKGTYVRKKINTMNSKMTTNSPLSTTEPKKTKNKYELSKQLEQEQIHRNEGHMKCGRLSSGREENEGKGTGNKKCKW